MLAIATAMAVLSFSHCTHIMRERGAWYGHSTAREACLTDRRARSRRAMGYGATDMPHWVMR